MKVSHKRITNMGLLSLDPQSFCYIGDSSVDNCRKGCHMHTERADSV